MKRPDLDRLLPEVMQRAAQPGQPLAAALDVMEGVITPVEDTLSGVDAALSPYRAPDAFVPWLAGWLALDGLLRPGPLETQYAPGLTQLRLLIARTMPLNFMRGTARGLIGVLEAATGVGGFRVQENVTASGGPRAFHLLVLAPPDSAVYAELVRQLVELEKPVALTHEVVWPAPAPGGTS